MALVYRRAASKEKAAQWRLSLRLLLMFQVAFSTLHLVYLDRIKPENLPIRLYPWISLQLAFSFILNLAVTPVLALAEVHLSPHFLLIDTAACCYL